MGRDVTNARLHPELEVQLDGRVEVAAFERRRLGLEVRTHLG
jgi:hypothetical protein